MSETTSTPQAGNLPIGSNRSRISAILGCRCPQCRQGEMFPHGTYNLKKFGIMHKECQVCGQDFQIEPGFYFGASYFSYGLNVFLIIAFVASYFVFFDQYSEWFLIGIILTVIVFLIPVNFRLSRSLMLQIGAGVKYKRQGTKAQ